MGKFGGRGKIPETFSPGDGIDLPWKNNEFAKQYRLWILTQYKDNSPIDNEPHIPSFAAVKSLLDSSTFLLLRVPLHQSSLTQRRSTMLYSQPWSISTMWWNKRNVKMVLFGRMKGCTILQKKYSSCIHKNVVIYPLGLVASIKKRQSLVVWVCTSNQVVSKICQSKKRFMDLQLATQLWVVEIIFGVKEGCL